MITQRTFSRLASLTVISTILAAGSGLHAAEAPDAPTLADILVDKGIISPEEAARIQTPAEPGLAQLLVRKGILSAEEVRHLGETPEEAPVFARQAAEPPMPSPPPTEATTGQVPPAPPSVTSQFALSLYGYVKLDAIYDSQRTEGGEVGFFVRPESPEGDDDALHITAKQTRLGLRVAAPTVSGWKSRARAEIDFYGSASENGSSTRMRLAYLSLENGPWQILAGQAYDAWNMVLPKLANYSAGGKQGTLWSRRPLIRATRTWELDNGATLAGTLGAARHIGLSDVDALGDSLDGGEDSALPLLQWNLQYATEMPAGEARFGMGGHYGKEEVERFLPDGSDDFVTSLLMVSADLPLTDFLSLTGAVWTGENLSNYQGGVGQGINLVRNTEIAASGGWVQMHWNTTPELQFNFGYGIDNPDDGDISPGGRLANTSWTANVFWTFLPSTTWILEYQYLDTEYAGAADAENNRVQSSLIMKF
jgi:hypothetical protein